MIVYILYRVMRLLASPKYYIKTLINHSSHDPVPIKFPNGRNYGALYINPEDKGLSWDIIVWNVREPLSMQIFFELLNKEDIIFDVGANIGYYVILEGLKAREGHIYAIEPVEENYRLLQQNIILNRLKNVTPFKCAMSDLVGRLKIFVGTRMNLSTMNEDSIKQTKDLYETRETRTTTLDDLVRDVGQFPSVLRMDLEGYEYTVIKGGKQVLKNLRLLFVEVHSLCLGMQKTETLLQKLGEYGFDSYIFSSRYLDHPFPYKMLRNKYVRWFTIALFKVTHLAFKLLQRNNIANIFSELTNGLYAPIIRTKDMKDVINHVKSESNIFSTFGLICVKN